MKYVKDPHKKRSVQHPDLHEGCAPVIGDFYMGLGFSYVSELCHKSAEASSWWCSPSGMPAAWRHFSVHYAVHCPRAVASSSMVFFRAVILSSEILLCSSLGKSSVWINPLAPSPCSPCGAIWAKTPAEEMFASAHTLTWIQSSHLFCWCSSSVVTLALNLWAFNTCRDCLSTHRQCGLSTGRL